ncbi:TolC family protein [Emticicia sp. BO119]|uniref:TolC family protein n=1 Tax=Emticicia sp. BO119 TaxID=2757768 RepID=UPI0015F11165|nr:TolC family protein [Emticicia sp. BO119]MBA4851665.1 TolC family protein [Emticicia sp. BO119]
MKIKYLIFFLISGISVQAQQAFTLQQAVQYGIKNHLSVKNAELDIVGAELTIKQIKASGLPQINGNFSYTYNAIIPTQLIDAKNFDPNAPDGAVTKFKFGVPWAGQTGIGLNQLIFDATWLVGLKAAPVYRELARKGVTNNKIVVAENVAKAYYSVLVAEERSKILDLNIARIDSLIREMKVMNQQGFIEKIDLDRLEVQRNNLITETQKVKNLIVLSQSLLKFQMGMKIDEPIVLADKLSDVDIRPFAMLEYPAVDYAGRIEYSTLMVQRQLSVLDMERTQKGVIPKVSFSGSLGAGHSNTRFNPFERWFGSSALTLGVQIPIYDSGLRKIQLQQQRLALTKLDQSAILLRESFDLQAKTASINIKNGLESLDIQQRNLDLAKEVVRVTKIKYQAGQGSNIEVVNAESALKEAQTNYFAALYDLLIAKVDLDKAMGKLLPE